MRVVWTAVAILVAAVTIGGCIIASPFLKNSDAGGSRVPQQTETTTVPSASQPTQNKATRNTTPPPAPAAGKQPRQETRDEAFMREWRALDARWESHNADINQRREAHRAKRDAILNKNQN